MHYYFKRFKTEHSAQNPDWSVKYNKSRFVVLINDCRKKQRKLITKNNLQPTDPNLFQHVSLKKAFLMALASYTLKSKCVGNFSLSQSK